MLKELNIPELNSKLRPGRRGVLNCFQLFLGAKRKQCFALYGFGTASDEDKDDTLNEFHRAGDMLDRRYFFGLDNHELWVEGKLIGLCNIFSDVSPLDGGIEICTSLEAIFLLRQFRGFGLGSSFIDCIWDDLEAGYTAAIAGAISANAEVFIVRLLADFDSSEGEWIFNHLRSHIEPYIETASAAFQIQIDLEVDAG